MRYKVSISFWELEVDADNDIEAIAIADRDFDLMSEAYAVCLDDEGEEPE